jgi:hypothetical protein
LLEDKVLSRVSSAVILDAIASGLIPPPPRNSGETAEQAIIRATRGSFRFPPRLTIDVGRETQARLAELSMGVMSPQEIAAEDGMDAYVRAAQKADFAAFVQELAESRDVPESSIFLPAGQQLPSTPAQAASVGDKTGHEAAEAQAESVPQQAKPAAEAARPTFSVSELLAGLSHRRAARKTISATRMGRLAAVRRLSGDTVKTAEEISNAFAKL